MVQGVRFKDVSPEELIYKEDNDNTIFQPLLKGQSIPLML